MSTTSKKAESIFIGDLLKEFAQKNNLEKGLDAVDAKKAWFDLMKNGVAQYTKEVVLKNGVLYVWLTSAVLREELSYGKQKIIKLINEEVGKEVVKELVFR